jgi:hypothetical protein
MPTLNPGLPTFLAKQHHIVRDIRFGYDWASRYGHFRLVMSRPFIGWYKQRTFRPQIRVPKNLEQSIINEYGFHAPLNIVFLVNEGFNGNMMW